MCGPAIYSSWEARLMSETRASDAAASEDRATRRTMLRRMGSVGLAATIGAGLSEMLGIGSARAATAQKCCTFCNRDEFACGGTHCPPGYCCFKCPPCGVYGGFTSCLHVSCDYTTHYYCYG